MVNVNAEYFVAGSSESGGGNGSHVSQAYYGYSQEGVSPVWYDGSRRVLNLSVTMTEFVKLKRVHYSFGWFSQPSGDEQLDYRAGATVLSNGKAQFARFRTVCL